MKLFAKLLVELLLSPTITAHLVSSNTDGRVCKFYSHPRQQYDAGKAFKLLKSEEISMLKVLNLRSFSKYISNYLHLLHFLMRLATAELRPCLGNV